MNIPTMRHEHDLLGNIDVPADAYFGVQTQRAMDNFKITDIPISIEPKMISALGFVKKSAAVANMDVGLLSKEIC